MTKRHENDDELRRFLEEAVVIDMSAAYSTHPRGAPYEGPGICTGAELRNRLFVAHINGRTGETSGKFLCLYGEVGRACLTGYAVTSDGQVTSVKVPSGAPGLCLLEDPSFQSRVYPAGLPEGLPEFPYPQ